MVLPPLQLFALPPRQPSMMIENLKTKALFERHLFLPRALMAEHAVCGADL
jgi:hypothetical protein